MFNIQSFDFNLPLVIAAVIATLILAAIFRRDSLWCLLPALMPIGYYIYKTVYPFPPMTPMTPAVTAKIVWGFADAVMLFPVYIGLCGLGYLVGRSARTYICNLKNKQTPN